MWVFGQTVLAVSAATDNTNPNFLMAAGGIRNIPNSLGQICPDGPCFDLLSQGHITLARNSGLLTPVPEPTRLSLLALGLLGGGLARRWLNRVSRY
jgi:hypothetical protein